MALCPSIGGASMLSVRDIRFFVRLGVPDEERAAPQEIAVHLDIIFPDMPPCAKNDELADTFCYDALCRELAEVCRRDSYKLIERLGYACYDALKAVIGDKARLIVQIEKLAPPVEAIKGSAAFTCGDR